MNCAAPVTPSDCRFAKAPLQKRQSHCWKKCSIASKRWQQNVARTLLSTHVKATPTSYPLMSDISEIIRLVEAQGSDIKSWREAQELKFNELQKSTDQFILASQRPGASLGNSSEVKHLTTADGRKLPMLAREQKAADLYRTNDSDGFSLGDFARDAIVGSRKAQSSAALVPTFIGGQVIDMVRARTVIVEAGAGIRPRNVGVFQ